MRSPTHCAQVAVIIAWRTDANTLPTYVRRAASGTSGSKREAELGAQCSLEATVCLAAYGW